MTTDNKKEVRHLLEDFVKRAGSQKKAANMLGVSASTVNALCQGQFDRISDEMFRSIASQVRPVNNSWDLVETAAFKEITGVLDDAKLYNNVTWVTADAGSGKTTTARYYTEVTNNTYYILCSEDMHRGDFLSEISRALGKKLTKMNLRETLLSLVDEIISKNSPVLIFDEADKLSDSVFHYFIQLYNLLEERCGMVFLSTDSIERRIGVGLRYNKRGYQEFHSRIGRRFYKVDPIDAADVYSICHANGVIDERTIESIISDAINYDYDLRRVKKSVKKALRHK